MMAWMRFIIQGSAREQGINILDTDCHSYETILKCTLPNPYFVDEKELYGAACLIFWNSCCTHSP